MIGKLIELFLIGAAGAAVAYVTFNWDEVRDAVAQWLRDNGLERSALMEAWILFERAAARTRRVLARLFVRTRRDGVVQVRETVYRDVSQIDDPEVRAELERRRQVKRDVMRLVS